MPISYRTGAGAALLCAVLAACSAGEPVATAEPATPGARPATSAAPDTGTATPAPSGDARPRFTEIARLDMPVAMALRPGDDTLYVAEQSGGCGRSPAGRSPRSPS
nr:hypothetical protein GCM10020093_037780 [Planobispora longispora]